jgi:hypothetical protein
MSQVAKKKYGIRVQIWGQRSQFAKSGPPVSSRLIFSERCVGGLTLRIAGFGFIISRIGVQTKIILFVGKVYHERFEITTWMVVGSACHIGNNVCLG